MSTGEFATVVAEKKRYTYDDYCSWDDDKRWELIDGVPYAMSAPTIRHQEISMNLSREFSIFLRGKKCKVFASPIDVRLNAEKGDDTVVQPDLIIVCDSSKLEDNKACKGAPDLVVEILSPSTASIDLVIKLNKYQEAGVKEYWIVDPESNTVQVFTLEGSNYIVHAYGLEDEAVDIIPVGISEGFEVNLREVF